MIIEQHKTTAKTSEIASNVKAGVNARDASAFLAAEGCVTGACFTRLPGSGALGLLFGLVL